MPAGLLRRRRAERGAAAVEGALVLGFFVIPMLIGILAYGQYFWQRQKVAGTDLNISTSSVYGLLTCQELSARVVSLVQDAVRNAGFAVDSSTPADQIDVSVLNVVSGVGADVQVTIHVPVANAVAGLLPLPDDGVLVQELLLRVDNVHITTGESC
jgi:Flp pilus assembly protein TadG